VIDPLRGVLRSIDPQLPVANTRPLQSVYLDGALGMQRIVLQLVSSMGGLALCLAIIGLYALVAYSVRLRMREFGVRMSIGATANDILRLVLGDGARLAGIGIVIGLVLSLPVRRVLGAALAGVGPLSSWALVIVPVGVMAIALMACFGPARVASSVNPTTILRLD
jgi:ABC-type antimicrobial peptide transport system permease subunit